MKYLENIVIGKPLVDLWLLLGDNPEDKSYEDFTVFEEERFLPKILVKYGITPSVRELRRNRPDLCVTLDKLDCIDIEIGKGKKYRKFYVIVGE